jgi:hypothetical protein
MLAIDTNLIVRYLVGDDAGQAARARRLIDSNDVFVCTTVLLETEWALRSAYRFSAAQCAKALSDFAGLPRANLEDAPAAAKALVHVRSPCMEPPMRTCCSSKSNARFELCIRLNFRTDHARFHPKVHFGGQLPKREIKAIFQ